MGGYTGIILRVNLSKGKIIKESLKEELAHKYVGGRGLNSRFLYDEVKPGVAPLGPDNKIFIGVGPCNGTIVPGSQRFTVTSKSPLTGILGDTNSGGSFGAELKYAGYDMIIIEGQAQKPVYLWVDDDRVELRPAEHLWGKTTREAARAIEREIGDPDISVISIGPAGENLVRFANLIADLGRGLGKTGQGAVFGSKKLKAIAVRGTKGVRVAHPKILEEAVGETYKAWTGDVKGRDISYTHTLDLRAKYGPSAGWARYDKFGMFPTKNFQGGASWKSMLEGLDSYFVKQKACFSCPAGCNHLCVISDGPYAGAYCEGVELTLIDFGPRIGNDDMSLGLKGHELCDKYGLDYFETTSCIAFAMECFQRGILTEKDTDGLRLEWGSADAILKLIEMIAHKEGFGAILASGVKVASETIGRGSVKYAIQAKGQTLVGRDPRASKGWGLAYAVASRGPCHVRAYLPETYPEASVDVSLSELFKKYKDPTNPLSEEGKGELVKWHEDLTAFKNCMEICLFTIYPWLYSIPVPRVLARFYNAVTGMKISEDEVLHIGERIINIERAFNVREGLTRKDDTLPERVLKEPYPDGPAKGQVVNLEPMLDEYYEFRGWDKDSGLPTKKKLIELGLDDIADDLENMGKLLM